MVAFNEWQQARQLDVGDQLWTSDGASPTAAGVRDQQSPPTQAYNLTVSDIHTYFVAAGGQFLLVHNDCVPPDSDLGKVLARGGKTSSNEDEIFQHLYDNHGLDKNLASERLPRFKAKIEGNLDVILGRDGSVYAPRSGDLFRNLLDG